eukprot:SAG11_NODE_4298_length_1965_cov_1.415863_2_plen_104_part_00
MTDTLETEIARAEMRIAKLQRMSRMAAAKGNGGTTYTGRSAADYSAPAPASRPGALRRTFSSEYYEKLLAKAKTPQQRAQVCHPVAANTVLFCPCIAPNIRIR